MLKAFEEIKEIAHTHYKGLYINREDREDEEVELLEKILTLIGEDENKELLKPYHRRGGTKNNLKHGVEQSTRVGWVFNQILQDRLGNHQKRSLLDALIFDKKIQVRRSHKLLLPDPHLKRTETLFFC